MTAAAGNASPESAGSANPWTRRMCRAARTTASAARSTGHGSSGPTERWVSRGAVSELGVGASVVDVVDEREAPGAPSSATRRESARTKVRQLRPEPIRPCRTSARGAPPRRGFREGLDHLERQRRRLVRRREASAPGDTIEGAEGRPTPRPRRAPLLRGADAPRRHRTIDRARQGAHRPRIADARRARGCDHRRAGDAPAKYPRRASNCWRAAAARRNMGGSSPDQRARDGYIRGRRARPTRVR